MKHLKSIALGALISLSFAPLSNGMNNPDTANETYKALAEWFVKLKFVERINLKSAVDACKEIEWSKILEYVVGK